MGSSQLIFPVETRSLWCGTSTPGVHLQFTANQLITLDDKDRGRGEVAVWTDTRLLVHKYQASL